MLKPVRAKAGLPWPASGVYVCDKCHGRQAAQVGAIATRCAALHAGRQKPCNCAYFVLLESGAPDQNPVPAR